MVTEPSSNKYLQFQVERKIQEVTFFKLRPKMYLRKCNILCLEYLLCCTVPDVFWFIAHKKIHFLEAETVKSD